MRRVRVRALARLIACVAAVALLGATRGARRRRRSRSRQMVTVNDFYFGPTSVTIKKGGAVKWVWSGYNTYPHDVHLKKGPKGLKKKALLLDQDDRGDRTPTSRRPSHAGHLQVHLHDPPDGNEDDRHRQEVGRRWAPDPIDRASFLASAAVALICTLAGQRSRDRRRARSTSRLAGEVEGAAEGARRRTGDGGTGRSAPAWRRWSSARPDPRVLDRRRGTAQWNIVPTHRDQMMAEPVKQGKTTFNAYGYRPYSAGLRHAAGAGDGAGAADRSRSRRHRRSSTSATS